MRKSLLAVLAALGLHPDVDGQAEEESEDAVVHGLVAAAGERPERERQRDIMLAEQVKLLHATLPTALFTVLVVASVLVAVQWAVIDHRILLAWLGAIYALSAARTVLYLRYRQDETAANNKNWAQLFVGTTLLSGISWGAAAYLLFPPHNITHQVYLAFVLAGLAVQATIGYAQYFSHLPAGLVWLHITTSVALWIFVLRLYLATRERMPLEPEPPVTAPKSLETTI